MNFRGILFISLIFVTWSCDDKSSSKKTDFSSNGNRNGNSSDVSNNLLAELDKSRIPVQTGRISLRKIQNSYSTNSLLQAENDISLYLKGGETVSEVLLRTGAKVDKNQIIAKLDGPAVLFEYKKAEISLKEAKRVHGNNTKLMSGNHISKEEFTQSENELAKASAQYELAKQNFMQLTVRSPISGIVAENALRPHTFVESYGKDGTAPVRVVSMDRLWGVINLPVNYFSHVKPGLDLKLLSRAQSAVAHIKRIAPVVDKSTGTFRVEFELSNQELKFIPGERVSVQVPLGQSEERLVLPPDSVVFEGNQAFVYLLRTPSAGDIEKDVKFAINEVREDEEGGKSSKGGKGGKRKSKGNRDGAAMAQGSKKTRKGKDGSGGDGLDLTQLPGEMKKQLPKLREEAEKIPRAQKVRVDVDQIASGEYVLAARQEETGAKELGDRSELIVVGLYQLANDARLKVVDEL